MRKLGRGTRAAVVRRGRLGLVIMEHPREFVAGVVATAATAIIFINALFLQHGPHPAPIFATRPLVAAMIHRAPAAKQGAPPSREQLIADIQRQLGSKGFYHGNVDGVWGNETDNAVREFAHTAGLKHTPPVSDHLLRTITAYHAPTAAGPRALARLDDPIARLLAPSRRMLAVQRALSDFGYGQLKPTGVNDAATRVAIERFERDRNLPVDGRVSDRLLRALATMIGRPLE